jgi:hypothetical protein
VIDNTDDEQAQEDDHRHKARDDLPCQTKALGLLSHFIALVKLALRAIDRHAGPWVSVGTRTFCPMYI